MALHKTCLAAQAHFDRLGQLDRLDVRLQPGVGRETFLATLAALPLRAAAPDEAAQRVSNLSQAYRVNLTVLALVALFTGAFLVFSVQSQAVAKRVPQLALLGVLGMTARARLALVLQESALLGVLGAALGLALGTALALWHFLGARRAAIALTAALVLGAIVGALGFAASERFAERVHRTAAALAGDHDGVEHALSGRLAIWETAWRMGEAHPVNGVGVRAFRHAYPEFAEAGDPFVDAQTGQGAFHAHQIVLELWSETGAFGLLCWLLAALAAWRAWRRCAKPAREAAMPAAIALCVALFPFNTHYAAYSAFWGLFLVWLAGVWLALLAGAVPPGSAPD